MSKKFEFKSLEELYKRITPALESKRKEFVRSGKNYIQNQDIWNFLSDYTWKHKNDLDLNEMVIDVFDINEIELDNYVLNILKREKREIKTDNEDLL